MKMRLHGPQRSFGLAGDLVERELAEEAQRDRPRDTARAGSTTAFRRSAARSARRASIAGSVRGPAAIDCASMAADAGSPASGPVGRRVDPGDGAPLTDLAQRDANGDAGQPGTERPLATPPGERSIGGHERLLGGVLGLVEVAEDPMAGSDDRRRFALDQMAERVSVAGEDGFDDRAVAVLVVRTGRG